MAELRRNPITRKWIVYVPKPNFLELIAQHKLDYPNNPRLFDAESSPCPHCRPQNTVHSKIIMSVKGDQIRYIRNKIDPTDWDVLTTSSSEPIFRIEDYLKRQSRRLYDVMGSPGAHEIIIMTPEHGVAPWELSALQHFKVLRTLRERLIDLDRDLRLGHPYAYSIYGGKLGAVHNHSTIDLILSPFISEKIQKELSGAHEWFKIKERCLFCDIYEEELLKRDKQKSHGIIDENDHFVAFVPFFTSHPFEVWIQPIEHYSSLTDIPEQALNDLSALLESVLTRQYQALGCVEMLIAYMNRPNIRWGANRGYWDAIAFDWHWRLRLLPEIDLDDANFRTFFHGTGSRVNPVLPEAAADYLRSF